MKWGGAGDFGDIREIGDGGWWVKSDESNTAAVDTITTIYGIKISIYCNTG